MLKLSFLGFIILNKIVFANLILIPCLMSNVEAMKHGHHKYSTWLFSYVLSFRAIAFSTLNDVTIADKGGQNIVDIVEHSLVFSQFCVISKVTFSCDEFVMYSKWSFLEYLALATTGDRVGSHFILLNTFKSNQLKDKNLSKFTI